MCTRPGALSTYPTLPTPPLRMFSDWRRLRANRWLPATPMLARSRPTRATLTDAQIRAVAQTGGVVGVNFHSPFLAVRRRATLADVVKHILHIRRLVGIDHVAIGSDYEGGIRPARGLESVRGLGSLAGALAAAGLSPEEVKKVFGLNALRLLCQKPQKSGG